MAWFASFLSTAAFIQKLFSLEGGWLFEVNEVLFFMKINRILRWTPCPPHNFRISIYSFSMNRSKIHWIGDLKHNTPINYKKKTKLSKTFIRLNIFITWVKWTAVVSTFFYYQCLCSVGCCIVATIKCYYHYSSYSNIVI